MGLKEIAARCWSDCQITGADRDARGEGIILMYLQQAIEEDGDGRPDFEGFAKSLLDESSWSASIHDPDTTGQARSDQGSLHRLAEHVGRVGRQLGFLNDPKPKTDIRQLVRTLSRDELHKLFSRPCKYKGCRANTKKVNCNYCNQHHYIIQELERRDKNA